MNKLRRSLDVWWERSSRKLQRLLTHLVPIIALVLIGMAYYLGVRTERTGFVSEVLDPNLKRITQPVLNAFRGRPPVVQKLEIRMSEESMDSLRSLREDALESGWLHKEAGVAFPVECAFGEHVFTGAIELLEGPSQQLTLRRWPFHLLLDTGDTLFQMGSMDLRPVADIAALHSWIMHQALRDRGLLAFGHEMLELRLNDQDLGLYTVEGLADSAMLAHWHRGPGPVIRFDDVLLAGARAAMEERSFPSIQPPQGDWLVAPILRTASGTVTDDPVAARRLTTAVEQLEKLRSGKERPSEIFDIPALAQLFALSDLLGGQKQIAWWNLRFLADSIPSRLIAIPRTTIAGSPIEAIAALQLKAPLTFDLRAAGFHDRLFNDSIFYQHYIASLDTFSSAGWLEGLFSRLGDGIEERGRIIKAEYPQEMLDTSIFMHNRTVIDQTLRPKDLVLAYTDEMTGERQRLALANVHSLPVRVLAVITGTDTLMLPQPVVLFPRELDKPLEYTLVNVRRPRDIAAPERVLVHVLGLKEMRTTSVRTWTTFEAN